MPASARKLSIPSRFGPWNVTVCQMMRSFRQDKRSPGVAVESQGRSFLLIQISETMKRTHLLAATIAAAIALAPVLAEDTTKPEATDQAQEQKDCCKGMMRNMMGKEKGNMAGMDMGNMMSKWKDQQAELDKLVADMNSAPSDKKADAVAAVVTKLVEQHKAMHEGLQKM